MVSDATMNSLMRERARRVRKAERESGFKEGEFTLDGRSVRVVVTFYCGEQWWVDGDEAGKRKRLGPLTEELWARMT